MQWWMKEGCVRGLFIRLLCTRAGLFPFLTSCSSISTPHNHRHHHHDHHLFHTCEVFVWAGRSCRHPRPGVGERSEPTERRHNLGWGVVIGDKVNSATDKELQVGWRQQNGWWQSQKVADETRWTTGSRKAEKFPLLPLIWIYFTLIRTIKVTCPFFLFFFSPTFIISHRAGFTVATLLPPLLCNNQQEMWAALTRNGFTLCSESVKGFSLSLSLFFVLTVLHKENQIVSKQNPGNQKLAVVLCWMRISFVCLLFFFEQQSARQSCFW